MRYLLLIYGAEQAMEAPPDDPGAAMKPWYDYTDWLVQQGWMKAGEALAESAKATTVTTQTGDRVVTDGPFAETKEQLGGYYEIDVPNLDDAIEAAARCPGSSYGSIEIRPIAELPPPPEA